jgi:membrane protease YdiL (CAAX protease family)
MLLDSAQLYATIAASAAAGFLAGLAFAAARGAWRSWRGTKAAVPGLRKSAFASAFAFVRVAAIGTLVIGMVAVAAYARGNDHGDAGTVPAGVTTPTGR